MRSGCPAEEPAAVAWVGGAAGGVKPAAGDGVGESVGGGPEPGPEGLVDGVDVVAEAGEGLGLGGWRAEAEEVDGLPPGVGGVLDRPERGASGDQLLDAADGPGQGPVGEVGGQPGDVVAQVECVDEDGEVVDGQDLALLQDGPVRRDGAAGPVVEVRLPGASGAERGEIGRDHVPRTKIRSCWFTGNPRR